MKLTPDEKRQRAAADRSKQRMELKNLMKQRKLKNNNNDDDEIIILTPTKNQNDSQQPTITINSKDDKKKYKDGLISDIESDCSIDLDELIAQTSDLDAGGGVNLGDDLARHLTPSTTPLRGPSPNFNTARPVSIIAEEEESLSDTPLEIDNQEADDLWKTSNNEDNIFDIYCGKSGIPAGMSKSAFFGHFGISPLTPLSPTSSQASSTADPDELFETMSNGSTRSAASTSSRGTITGSGTRKPSNTLGIRAPSRIDH
ncbi:24052_t:CDS:2 [Entrophospora sp. SA101]|nr:24052_t:CDS:2 [Entrophospora sp. SA101]CAJ0918929.1 16347_t:CDS:2 [Entrophospora sp. SA101]